VECVCAFSAWCLGTGIDVSLNNIGARQKVVIVRAKPPLRLKAISAHREYVCIRFIVIGGAPGGWATDRKEDNSSFHQLLVATRQLRGFIQVNSALF